MHSHAGAWEREIAYSEYEEPVKSFYCFSRIGTCFDCVPGFGLIVS